MPVRKPTYKPNDGTGPAVTRREFVAAAATAGWLVTSGCRPSRQPLVTARVVNIPTPDGICDAVFVHPSSKRVPGVLVWHDSPGVRPAMRQLAHRMALEGFAVLLPNLFYRAGRAPVFPDSFDYASNAAHRELYRTITAPFFTPGAAERDALAFVQFLDAQDPVDSDRSIGTHGYCLGGPYTLKTAAAVPGRVGAVASLHGGGLVTTRPDSPHLLAPSIRAPVYIAIASDDDRREPETASVLRKAFSEADVVADIEVFRDALHGWCVPDSGSAYDPVNAERAWAKLVALYRDHL